jgi:methionyl-tRNA formyltransferase
LAKVGFIGSKSLGLRLLRKIQDHDGVDLRFLVHPDDRSDERSRLREFQENCRRNKIQMEVTSSPRTLAKIIGNEDLDFAIVCGWYRLIGVKTLSLTKRGVYAFHHGLLPKYRGGAPLVWAIINGDPEVGSTLFRMGDGVDDGDLVCQWRVKTKMDDHIGDIIDRLETKIEANFPETLQAILDGAAKHASQNHAQATYCAQRTPEDGRIDWRWPAERIYNFARAQSEPYPGAFTSAAKQRVHIWRTQVGPAPYYCSPGQIISRGSAHVLIGCGDSTTLRIETVTVEGVGVSPRDAFPSLSLRLMD